MFSYKTPDSFTPPEFTKSAREKVLSNLRVTSKDERPQVLGSSPSIPSSINTPILSPSPSLTSSIGSRDESNNLLHYSFNRTSPTLDSRRSSTIEPTNVTKRIKTGPGFLSRLKSTKKDKFIGIQDIEDNTSQHAYTHTNIDNITTGNHNNHALNHTHHFTLPPLSRTSSRSSISTGSIFSSNSTYSGASSISDYSSMNHNHNNKDSREGGLSYSYSYSPNVRHIGFVQILDQINSSSSNTMNIGKSIFDELNNIVNNLNINGTVTADNHPDKLIDWNLNLMRLLMFTNDDTINNVQEEIRVNLDAINTNAILSSELIKFYNSTSNNAEFKEYFLQYVMNPSVLSLCQENQGKVRLDLRIEKVKKQMNDESFCELLINSELFKEFNIDSSFKRLLANISVEKARGLQNSKYSNSSNYLLDEFKCLALRNYFLNLLVASQTLFEYHFSLSSIINRPISKPGLSLVATIAQFSDSDKKWLWDNIRERNFNKIKIFDYI